MLSSLARASVLVALLTMPLAAQTKGPVSIGTDPAAESFPHRLNDVSDQYWQTFVAQGDYLESLSFWLTGGSVADPRDPDLEAWVSIGPFTGPLFSGGRTANVGLDLTVNGRYDIFFDAVRVSRGETYAFAVTVTNCTTWTECQNQPLTGVFAPATLEYTTTDAYLDGYAGYNAGNPAGPDIRFEATFSVPEPGTLLLLMTGLCGLGMVAVRRRRSADP